MPGIFDGFPNGIFDDAIFDTKVQGLPEARKTFIVGIQDKELIVGVQDKKLVVGVRV